MSRCGPAHILRPGAVPAIVMSMLAGAAMIFGIKCGDAAKSSGHKNGADFCDQNCHGFLFPHSAAGNLQLYLPMRVVRFACQPQLPFRTIAAAMIYTGESCDDLLQASETNCVAPYTSTRSQPCGFLLAFLLPIFRSQKRSQKLGPKMGP